MRDHGADPPLRRKRAICGNIRFIERLRRAAARVPRKELERVRADGDGLLPHMHKPLRRGKMAPDPDHHVLLFLLFCL